VLAVALLAPWGVVWMGYVGAKPSPVEPAETQPTAAPARTAREGPWGRLTLTPIIVSPPLEYVSTNWGPPEQVTWRFPGSSAELVGEFLATVGLPADTLASLRGAIRPDPAIRGVRIQPDPAIVRGLHSLVRARIYEQLARSPVNPSQAHAFRFRGDSTEAWLGGSLMQPSTRALVEPLIYRSGDYLYFGDIDLVRASLPDDDEVRRLSKTLLRQSTLMVKLSIGDAAEVPGLAEYWGRGGRRTDIRPLLESLAAASAGSSIDIIHLLPTFARNHLYRYPKVTTGDLQRPLLANCLWTSLNFFNIEPDDRFLDVDYSFETLKRDHRVVTERFALGDIITLEDQEGVVFHAAVYIADELVLTKNGTSPVAPWAIMSVDDLKGYYRPRSVDPRLVYHRRNGD